jgi:ribonuclease J
MVSISFHGGVGEIGGNKILLEDGDTKIWLDFGQTFTMGEEYYAGWLKPRNQSILKDLFEFKLLPEKGGLYDPELLTCTTVEESEPRFDGVLLSHAHSDHVNHVSYMDPRIPVYLGSGTRLFMEAMEKTSAFARYGKRDYRCFRTGDRFRVGDVEVEPIHVDHSIPGAYGYILHTSEGAVVYTGDLRAHGTRAEMTDEFLEAAERVKPVVMISEGTRMVSVEKRRNMSEPGVLAGVREVCGGAGGCLVLFTHGPRDMDRLRTFYTASVECGRRLVVDTKTAHLLMRLVEDEHLDLPDPRTDDSVGVYYRKKRSGSYIEKDYYRWERAFMDRMVTSKDLKADPGCYSVNIGFTAFGELIDIKPEAGTPFIYSMSEAFGEEDLEERVMHNWLNHFNLEYIQLHASGHLSRSELVEAIQRVNPGILYPVHTEAPELFKEHFSNAIPPEIAQTYEV